MNKGLLLVACLGILVPVPGLAQASDAPPVDAEARLAPPTKLTPRSERIETLLKQFSATDCGTSSDAGCYLLTLTASDNGKVPVADPPCEEGVCVSGRYLPGAPISVIAAPDLRYGVGSWQGTNNDASTLRINQVTMPSQDHGVQVNYVERPDSSGFSSSFEIGRFGDWWLEFCDPCDVSQGTVATGASSFAASTSTAEHRCGAHRALLVGNERADLDLHLWRRDGPRWVEVASDVGPQSEKAVEYRGEPGEYRWEVRSTGRGGPYELWSWHQGAFAAPPNRVEQSSEESSDGGFSLKSIYGRGSTGRFFLIDQTPFYGDGESEYNVSFKIRPRSGLRVKSKKHLILRMRQFTAGTGDNTVLEVFLTQVKNQANTYGVFVRTWRNNRKSRKSREIRLPADTWTAVRIEWRAASAAGMNDGRVSFYQPEVSATPVWQRALSNFGDRAELIYFGQVSKGKKGTSGVVYFDEFQSSWN